jgi:hypothetical protein
MTVNNATHWFPNGEVEDYQVIVSVILPVNLLSFTASLQPNNSVLLNWVTGKEINFKGFDVERSKDGLLWQKIAFVAAHSDGQGNNSYTTYDNDPVWGTSFYRLKLLDIDGHYRYSEVRSIEVKQINTSIRIVPNPVYTEAILKFTADKNDIAQVYVISMEGKRCMSRLITVQAGVNAINLAGWDKLSRGVYIVQVVLASGTMNTKVVVQPNQ